MSTKIDEKWLVNQLTELGLSEKESRVYLALLPQRDCGLTKIMRTTGLHGQFVYNALDTLEKKGLTRHVIQRGRRKFSANPPKQILSLLAEKRAVAQAVVKQLEKRFTGVFEHDFEVLQGINAFVAHQFLLIDRTPENSVIGVISGPNDKYFTTLDNESSALEYERLRVKKNIQIRYIGSASQIDALKKWEREREKWTYKVFPGLSTGLVDIGIWHDSVIFNTFGTPVLSFVLTAKDVASGYREFFDALWELSVR
ncbi:MAG: transcriptional regulator TrmB [Parcubacteria group bacterium Athens0416_74]|nr:MAG: transcriptional regulator TrmB [Parcubacteria group bacterium Athens0416_74]